MYKFKLINFCKQFSLYDIGMGVYYNSQKKEVSGFKEVKTLLMVGRILKTI